MQNNRRFLFKLYPYKENFSRKRVKGFSKVSQHSSDGRVMGTGTLVHSLGSMNLSPMIPYLIFNKDSIFKSNSSVRLKKGKTSSSDHSKQSS